MAESCDDTPLLTLAAASCFLSIALACAGQGRRDTSPIVRQVVDPSGEFAWIERANGETQAVSLRELSRLNKKN